ncbi:MAG: phosphoglyceromutase [Sphingobacteriaceae bacterium]|nr:MAG: phosphoglyceromutase [Sphingobacteriaceae bacterium]
MKKLFTFSMLLFISISVFAQRKTKNVIVITLDGYRWQELFRGPDSVKLFKRSFFGQDSVSKIKKHWAPNIAERRERLMPFFWNTIAKQGQLYGNRDLDNLVNVTNPHKVSHAGYSEMFIGWADPKITNGSPNNPHQNIFEFFNKQPGYKDKVAVMTSWDEYYRILNSERNKFPIISGWVDVKGNNLNETQKLLNQQQHYMPKIFGNTERLDAATYPMAKEYIKQNHPKVFYLAFIDTDAFAHRGQYDFYLDAARNIDDMIADLWAQIQGDPFYKDKTTLFITTDHGRGENADWTDHGSRTPNSDQIWFAVMGPDTKALGELKTPGQIYQKQFAKTISAILGFDFTSPNPIGEVIPGVVKK